MTSIYELRVRSYECDIYTHVNNAIYLHYLEAARYQFLKDAGFDYEKALRDGYGIYTARIEIDYKRSAYTDDLLHVRSYPIKKGSVSGVIAQDVFLGAADGPLIASAKVTWAFVDGNGKPVKLPPEYDLPALAP